MPDSTDVELSAAPRDEDQETADCLEPEFLVGVGASAGGLEALQALFDGVSREVNAAFVVIQHLAPDFRSLMPELLQRHTGLEVEAVRHGVRIQTGHVYLIPPARNMIVSGGRLFLSEQDRGREMQLPIDLFLRSLAHDAGPRAVAIVLSGTGSDGSRGIVHVAEAGGRVIVQQPESAGFDGMPRSAIRTGCAHAVLPAAEIGPVLASLLSKTPALRAPLNDLDSLLDFLSEQRSVDLRRYRRATLWRRIERRMRAVGVESLQSYREHVEQNVGEAANLAQEILIGVTRFFRDEDAFASLRQNVLPRLFDARREGDVLRVWTPGCATGEEAYSIAIAIEECARERGVAADYKIFATDIDPKSLARAARGAFPAELVEGLDADLVARYFLRYDEELRIHPSVREHIVFARQDLTRDAPFTRIDLAVCRNLLIYFEPEHQRRVLDVLHFALRPNGYLFLGSSESLGDIESEFSVIDPRWKLYQKLRDSRLSSLKSGVGTGWLTGPPRVVTPPLRRGREALLEAACSALVPAGGCLLIVDANELVLHTFGDVGRFLSWGEGPTSWQLSRIVEPALRTLAVSAFQRALRETGEVLVQGSLPTGATARVVMNARAIRRGNGGNDVLVALTLRMNEEPVLLARRNEVAIEGQELLQQRIGDLDEQLNQTREILQATIEELEASNEELQATNEELLAANEELHGTNEELQSVNEELYTVNQEHQAHIQRLAELGTDMDQLLESLEDGTILLDEHLLIRRYTPSADRHVRLMAQDVGRPLEHLQHELAGIDLCSLVNSVLADREARDVLANTRAGRYVRVRVRPYASRGGARVGAVLSFVDVDRLERTLRELSTSEERFRELAAHIDEVFWMCEPRSGRFVYVSPRAMAIWGLDANELLARPEARVERAHPEDRARVEEAYSALRENGEIDIEYRVVSPEGAVRWVHDRGFPIRDEGGALVRIAGLASDISTVKERESKLVALAGALESQANNDPLTGLLNRRGLEKELLREAHRVLRSGTPVSAILIDCDDFKRVNDMFGHTVGDGVLTSLAQKIGGVLRGNDLLARVGGDEFLAVLPDTRSAEALSIAERIRLAASATTLSVAAHHVAATVSLGVVSVASDMLSIEEIVTQAHGALERSKRSGKNRVSGSVDGDLPTSGRVLDVIRTGAALRCLAQPIVDLDGGALRAVEFLTRCPQTPWTNPTELFRTAIEQDSLTSVDLCCLRACVETAARVPAEIGLHFNLYPSTLVDVPTPRLLELFDRLGDPKRICIEISEQQFLGEPTYLAQAVEALRMHGVRVALDDVGFGRSSLESLLVLRPEVVKLDRSLVHGVHGEIARRSTLKRLMGLLQSSGATVIAEGVEDERDVGALREVSVELAQGYFFGHPAVP